MTLEQEVRKALSPYLICNIEDDMESFSFDYSSNFDELIQKNWNIILRYLIETKASIRLWWESGYLKGGVNEFDLIGSDLLEQQQLQWTSGHLKGHVNGEDYIALSPLDDRLIFNFENEHSFGAMVWQMVLLHCGSVWSDDVSEESVQDILVPLWCEQWNIPGIIQYLQEYTALMGDLPALHDFMAYKGGSFLHTEETLLL